MWNPILYDKFKDERSKPFWDLLGLVQPQGIKRVVDLGCGTGELTAQLHKRLLAHDTLGIDSSNEMLAKSSSHHLTGLKFKQCSVESFSPPEKYDLVFSNATLQWIGDHKNLFPKVLSWVNPKGQVAIQMPCNFDHPSHVIAAQVAKQFIQADEVKLNPILPVERYAQILYENGFHEQRCRIEVYLHPMKSGADVIEWTRGTLLTAYQSKMSPEKFAEFVKLYREQLLAVIGEGPYVYPFKRILMWGKHGD